MVFPLTLAVTQTWTILMNWTCRRVLHWTFSSPLLLTTIILIKNHWLHLPANARWLSSIMFTKRFWMNCAHINMRNEEIQAALPFDLDCSTETNSPGHTTLIRKSETEVEIWKVQKFEYVNLASLKMRYSLIEFKILRFN